MTPDAAFARRNRERCRPRECPARKGQRVPAACWVEAAQTKPSAQQCPACAGRIVTENWSPVP
jgi:hypothetical protein